MTLIDFIKLNTVGQRKGAEIFKYEVKFYRSWKWCLITIFAMFFGDFFIATVMREDHLVGKLGLVFYLLSGFFYTYKYAPIKKLSEINSSKDPIVIVFILTSLPIMFYYALIYLIAFNFSV